MSIFKSKDSVAVTVVPNVLSLVLLCFSLSVFIPVAIATELSASEKNQGLGRSLSSAEIDALDTHIFLDGTNLPAGQGSVAAGRELYSQHCSACHGHAGEGGSALELVGDRALLTTPYPDKGIGVYWPYAPTLFQYIKRAMPPEHPGLFDNNELYSLVGFVLYLSDLLPEAGVVNRTTLANVELPNKDGFVDQLPIPK